jgi:CcmD family protein
MRRFIVWVAFCAGVALFSPLASAQDAQNTPDDRAASFQAVSGGTQEDVAGGPLMLLAYAAVWLVIFGYVYRINKLQRGVEANLERLERSIARQGTSAS